MNWTFGRFEINYFERRKARGTFYYLCSLLDGCRRFIVHWEIHEQMTEADVEIIIRRAKGKFLEAHPRIVSDNWPQFIARDFKEFIRLCGMTHVKTSPFHPRWQERLKQSIIDKEHVFVCQDGTPFCEQYYGKPFIHRQHLMERLCARAKVKPFGFHGIRHLTASILY